MGVSLAESWGPVLRLQRKSLAYIVKPLKEGPEPALKFERCVGIFIISNGRKEEKEIPRNRLAGAKIIYIF